MLFLAFELERRAAQGEARDVDRRQRQRRAREKCPSATSRRCHIGRHRLLLEEGHEQVRRTWSATRGSRIAIPLVNVISSVCGRLGPAKLSQTI
jgi:hypothetical protein